MSLAVRMSGLVVVMPLVLRRFPSADVAVWQLFTTVFTLMLMLDLGLGPSFARLLSYARGGASIQEMGEMRHLRQRAHPRASSTQEIQATLRRLVGALDWIYPRIALTSVLFFSIVGTWALRRPIAACNDPSTMWIAWGIVLVGAGGAFLGNAAGATLQGLDQIAAQRRLEVVTGLGQAATSVAVVLLGGGLLPLVATYQGWAFGTVIFNRLLLKRVAPELSSGRATADRDVMRVIWPTAWRSGLGVLASQGVIQLSGILYGQLVDPVQLASYLLALRLVSVLSQISQAPFYSQLPHLASLYAAGRREEVVTTARHGVRLSQWVLCLGLAAGAWCLPQLLRLIGSQTPFVSAGVWSLLSLAFVVERFGAMHLQIYSLTNHIVWHVLNGATGALMLLLAVSGVPLLGLAAFPLGMLIAYGAVYATWASRLASRHFGYGVVRFESGAGLPPFLILVAALSLRMVWPQ